MACFVLVHGSFSGAHTWRKVRPLLSKDGHEVFTPSLTGIGERSHLTGPQVGLTTHVRDVANTILYEDLTDVVLLGYSYGGRVVTGALEFIGDRVGHLVYLDSSIPNNGDVGGGGSTTTDGIAQIGIGADWLMPLSPRDANDYEDPVEAEWSAVRRSPMPIGTAIEPVRLLRPLEDFAFTRTYIKATGVPRPAEGGAAWAAADRAKSSPAWRYREIDTNHLIPRNRPEELVEFLLELA